MKDFLFLAFTILPFLTACGAYKSSTAASIAGRNWNPEKASPSERAYCTEPVLYTESYRVSGNAKYQYRNYSLAEGETGLREVESEARPIRHAQFEVLDSHDRIVQCGETDATGSFDFEVPQNNKALTLKIYSRANNFNNRASVFVAPETNQLYSLDFSFTANENWVDVNLIAQAKGEPLLGGAFNILDQINTTWDVLRTRTQTSTGLDVSNIPKVDIYWEAGFNPSVYIGSEAALSFFSHAGNHRFENADGSFFNKTYAENKIFILGGLNGDVDFADTDHFDNSVIIHEYFHFLEQTVSRRSSPGGAHDGNSILDPKLAWSEGGAQFFQGVILDFPAVIDTFGNVDGDTGFILPTYSIENAVNDHPIAAGEGSKREFAVARFLWDLHDEELSSNAPETFDTNIQGHFPDFWAVFTDKDDFAAGTANLNNFVNFFNSAAPCTGGQTWLQLFNSHKVINPPCQ